MLDGAPFRGTILVSHVHWDHVQGLPFFAAGDRAGASVRLVLPAQGGKSGRDLDRPDDVAAGVPDHARGPDRRLDLRRRAPRRARGRGLLGAGVRGRPQGRSHLRLHGAPGRRARSATCPTTRPSSGVSDDALAALAGVDYLVHDAQFLEHERPRAVDYGHATVDDAIRLAERVDAGAVVLFHHGPHRTDDALDEIGRQFTASIPIVIAAEGNGLDLA